MRLPRLILSNGALGVLADELVAMRVHQPLVVTDRQLAGLGHLDKLVTGLGRAVDYVVFDDVPENPTFDGVDRAAELYRARQCDGVIALGGGSVIDTAKLVAVLGCHPGRAADYVGYSERVTAAVAPLVAIPTTAGTGSEASPDAGIHPDSKSVSSGISSPHVVPRLALCDPELTLTLPRRLTAATGIDALSHCIEGYLSITPNRLADAMALDGIGRICRNLVEATENEDIEARWQMMVGAFAGGASIAKGLGPAHAIAICCGDQGLHHGMLCGVGLLASLPAMESAVPDRVAQIRAAMNLPSGSSLAEGLFELMRRLALPCNLTELGYTLRDLDALAEACADSHFNFTSPYAPSKLEYTRMLQKIMS